MTFTQIREVLPEHHYLEIKKLYDRIIGHRTTHRKRQGYYDGENRLKDLGISLPPSLRNLAISMAWPEKAVESVSSRLVLEGFSSTGDTEEMGIDRIFSDNQIEVEANAIHTSALLHGCAFLAAFNGNPVLGEPKVIVRSFPATHASGTLLPNARRLANALLILDENESGPTRLFFTTDTETFNLQYSAVTRVWIVEQEENLLGRVPVEVMSFNASLKQPFGKSRLTGPMMDIVDSAMRTLARMEVSSEFFSTPARYILGANEEMFVDEAGNPTDAWKIRMSNVNVLPYNYDDPENPSADDGVMPQVGQFDASSPAPHTDVLRTHAQMFSAASSLPPTALGVVTDNPTSAESVRAQLEELLVLCRNASITFGSAWERVMKTAVALKNGLSYEDLPDDVHALKARFADPSTPTLSSQADAVMKLVSAGIVPADSDVVLEKLGFSESDILRIKTERIKAQAPSKLAEILQKRQIPASEES